MSLRLDCRLIEENVAELALRISERFKNHKINDVAEQLVKLCKHAKATHERLGRPIYVLRVVSILLSLTLVYIIALIVLHMRSLPDDMSVLDLLQALDAGSNAAIFLALSVYFIYRFEFFIRRKRIIHEIDRLANLASVVRILHLPKEPTRLLRRDLATEHSPHVNMTTDELERYLAYCRELATYAASLARVYALQIVDGMVEEAASDVSSLAHTVSNEVGQKQTVLQLATANLKKGTLDIGPGGRI